MDVWILLFIILAVYVLLHVVAYFIQDLFFFHPEKLRRDFQFKYAIPFEEVILKGEQESVIDALYFPVENSKHVVFYFKGNTRSIKGWAKFAKDFTGKGCSFFLFDYPGFGKSTGKRSEELIYANARIAYDWLKTKHPESEIIIYGRSLGAGFASFIAGVNNPSSLILDCPYFNFNRLIFYYVPFLYGKWILKYKMPLNKFIEAVKCPVYIIHGDKDWIIPFRFSKQLYDRNKSKIKLFKIKGGKHNNLPQMESYHAALNEILDNQ